MKLTIVSRWPAISRRLYQLPKMLNASDVPPKTFSMQETLPNLPLPKLSETLQRYLRCVDALVDDKRDVQKTEKLVGLFERSKDAELLQTHLMERMTTRKNWLEDWWYDAYNETRCPLPLQNMGSVVPRAKPCPGRQIHRAAEFAHHIMQYWIDLRKEKVPITTSRGEVWDMFQSYNLFNATRVPAYPKDRLSRHFRTMNEGDAPSHITVLCNGHIYEVNLIYDNELLPLTVIFRILKDIVDRSTENHVSIVPLTSEHRDTWTMLREKLIFHSPLNKISLDSIESSAFVMSLSSDQRSNANDMMTYALFGNPRSQWCDKNFNAIIMRDGQICFHADHCNVDAISLFSPVDEVCKRFRTDHWEAQAVDFPRAHRLKFDLTSEVVSAVVTAEKNFLNLGHNVNLNVVQYDGFGNICMKSMGLYTDTVIQIAIQLAYYKVHKKFAPTYETASTRKYYHGRTETVRSCTTQLVNFGRAVASGNPLWEQKHLFYKAYEAHNRLMQQARNGQGIDRHMFGLMKSQQELKEVDDIISCKGIFEDKSWKATGGSGNFKLSSSFLGYDPEGTYGYVTAMCEDGYGCFYRINPESLTFTTTCYKNNLVDLEKFGKSLHWALDHINSYFNVAKI